MKAVCHCSQIVVACLALACGAHAGWAGPPANIALSQDGRNILDTPEVAQARAAHISALQQASQNNPNPQDDGSYNPAWDNEEYWQRANGAPAQQWNGAQANQWNSAPAQQWNGAPAQQWNGAPAQQWNAAPAQQWNAGAPAPVAETPEVAQARAAHLAALSAAKSAAPAQQWNAPQQSWNAPAQQQWNAPAPQWNGAPSWQGAPAHQAANIQLARDGSGILETPEVAAARAAHLAAHSQAVHSAPPQQHQQQHW